MCWWQFVGGCLLVAVCWWQSVGRSLLMAVCWWGWPEKGASKTLVIGRRVGGLVRGAAYSVMLCVSALMAPSWGTKNIRYLAIEQFMQWAKAGARIHRNGAWARA